MESFTLDAELRTDLGKGASRRLRHADKVPAIIYGAGKDPQALTLGQNDLLLHVANEAFFSHILTVKIDGSEEQAIVKDMQRHPHKLQIMHIDLLRVSATQKIRVSIPLHFLNADVSPGVKEGGLVSHSMTEVEISCLPGDLPEFIEVDLADLELDANLHLSDIKLVGEVEIVELAHGNDLTIAAIHMPRAVKEEDEEADVAADDAEATGDESAEEGDGA